MSKNTIPKKYMNKDLMITSPYWDGILQRLTRPAAISLLKKLDKNNPCGIDPTLNGVTFTSIKKKSVESQTSAETILSAKLKHPDKIVLMRLGDFYEFFFIDAVLAIEYCGINQSGNGVPKAGVPIPNLQQTTNSLTSNGFSVVVIEQADIPGSPRKRRFISQILSPSSPIYIHSLAMDNKRDADFPDSPPIFGLYEGRHGVNLVEVKPDLRVISIMEGLTIETTLSHIEKYGSRLGKIYYHENISNRLNFLVKKIEGEALGEKRIVEKITNVDVFNFPISLENLVKRDLNLESSTCFTKIIKEKENSFETPRALNLGTAFQIGVLPYRGVPSLIDHVLPESSPVTCKNILREILLSPPPKNVARSIRNIISTLSSYNKEIPDFRVSSPARFVRTIQEKEASSLILRELRFITDDYINASRNIFTSALHDLVNVTTHITNLHTSQNVITKSANEIKTIIDAAVCFDEESDLPYQPNNKDIPYEFFSSLESQFRGRVLRTGKVEEAYLSVERAAKAYEDAITKELIGSDIAVKGSLVYDSRNEAIWLKGKSESQSLIHPKDRNGRIVSDRYSTKNVEDLLCNYKEAVEEARKFVLETLQETSIKLAKYGSEIIHITMGVNLLRTLVLHVIEVKPKGWSIEGVKEKNEGKIVIKDFFPYWLKKDEASLNSVELDDIIVLLGANAAGKSSLLRSVCTSVLLASCGLYIPASSIELPFVDGFFLRTGAQDDPASGLSAFQQEIFEINQLLNAGCSSSTLVLVDELGKGTESRQGAAIAGSILEYISNGFPDSSEGLKAKGIFATHWHEIFDMPLNISDLKVLHMETINMEPTYKLKEGKILSSLAFHAAEKLGLKGSIIERARHLCEYQNVHPSVVVDSIPIENTVEIQLPLITGNFSLISAGTLLTSIANKHPSQLCLVSERGMPPLKDIGRSCVYIIETKKGYYYVGETDNITERIKQHRKDEKKANSQMIYLQVEEGKSEARRLESELIKMLIKKKYPLLSSFDGTHRSFNK